MSPYLFIVRWLRTAVRAAVRAEVEQCMADRRAALRRQPDDAEMAAIRTHLAQAGVTIRQPRTSAVLPFPAANDHHTPPPSAA